jgi:ATP-binding cassette subfamily B protein
MNFVALKMLTSDRAKYLGLIFTIAFCTFLLENQTSIFAGILKRTGSLLFGATIRENIAWGAPDCTTDQIERAARLARAHEFIEKLPQGYDTVVGERGVTLSGGQRQRLAIARAAVRNAPLLIFDERTVGLDEENYRAIVQGLEDLSAERTTILIGHDLELRARADLILYLDDGRIAEQGSHRELLARDGLYARLYRLQASPLHVAVRSSPVPVLEV